MQYILRLTVHQVNHGICTALLVPRDLGSILACLRE